MANLAVQDISAGAAYTTAAATAGGDTIAQGTEQGGWHLPVVLVVENAGVGAQTVTVAGMAGVNVPASGRAAIPVEGGAYGKLRNITYSAVTSVTVAALRLTNPLE